jgi:ribosome-associated toxin RatA of RatAB toxin-antitoxin module
MRSSFPVLLVAAGLVLSLDSLQAPRLAYADTTVIAANPGGATQAASPAGRVDRYRVKTLAPASAVDTGGASAVIEAPLAEVRALITDYGHYTDFIPAFQQARVLSRKAGESEIYLQVPIAHGAATIWGVVRMAKAAPRPDPEGGEVVRGTFVKGNVADFRAAWHLIPLSESRTQLRLELLVVPQMPIPSSMLTSYLEGAAARGVSGVQKKLLSASQGALASSSSAASSSGQAEGGSSPTQATP